MRTGKQPTPNNIANRLQPIIADPLAIDATHGAVDVAHDVVEGYLVFGLAANRLACPAKPIEASAFDVEAGIDAQLPEAFRYLAIWGIRIAPSITLSSNKQ